MHGAALAKALRTLCSRPERRLLYTSIAAGPIANHSASSIAGSSPSASRARSTASCTSGSLSASPVISCTAPSAARASTVATRTRQCFERKFRARASVTFRSSSAAPPTVSLPLSTWTAFAAPTPLARATTRPYRVRVRVSKIGKFWKFFQIFNGLVLGCIKTKFCKKICV